ncbi:MAG TPA: NmrA family NAD(P)-binding protein, partial [Patescibacteria group bacterium]|nr:NmrA family NAD(P)-binding protein [Patescibacteria group bacterium]
ENLLKESGIPFTILRNGWYTENYEGSIANALGAGAFYGSAGNGKISAAPRKDYAEAIVAVVTSEDHEGKIYELAGDEGFTMSELAAEVSSQTGKNIPYTDLPSEEYTGALLKAGLPEGLAQMLAGMDVSTAKGDLFDDSHQLSKLIGRPTTPLKESLSKMLKQA